MPSTKDLMGSSQPYSSYPPLDSMDVTDAQPYLTNGRDFQMPEFEQHHDPQQERYQTPPVVDENSYETHPQNDAVLNGNIEDGAESKSASDPASPGRSKPVPKPDREVTKDANGRFYCNWAGCTEEIRDFNRKCEWR